MTDSEQKSGGLPTAAYEWRYVDWDEGHTVLRHDKPDRNSFDVELELKHELVRKSDVKNLIQDKIRQAEEKIEKYNAFDRLNLNDAKARKQELESLLDELEGESDE